MSDKITWTVRQIPREVITAAKMAARKERKTLGQWLSHVILEAAREGLSKKSAVAKPDDVADILRKMSDVQEQQGKLIEGLQKPWWKKIR